MYLLFMRLINGKSFRRREWKLMQVKGMLQKLAIGNPLDFDELILISSQFCKSFHADDYVMDFLSEIKNIDEYTYKHSIHTAIYSMLIGKWLQRSETEIEHLIISGLLHDIGKINIPKRILNKAGKYTEDEYEMMKIHPIYGYEMLKDIDELDHNIKMAVLLHHERMDGSGYPYHYKIQDINLYSRIVAIADVYDAMVSDRIYKKKMVPSDAIDVLMNKEYYLFDSKVLNIFFKYYSDYMIEIET